jgi:hypothetical protein
MSMQPPQNADFARRERDGGAIASRLTAAEVEQAAVDLDAFGVERRDRRPSTQCFHPRQELACAERFRQVVVRTRTQTGHALFLRAARREDENRQRRASHSQTLAHLDPIEARKREIEQHHVDVMLDAALGAGDAVTYGLDAEAAFE